MNITTLQFLCLIFAMILGAVLIVISVLHDTKQREKAFKNLNVCGVDGDTHRLEQDGSDSGPSKSQRGCKTLNQKPVQFRPHVHSLSTPGNSSSESGNNSTERAVTSTDCRNGVENLYPRESTGDVLGNSAEISTLEQNTGIERPGGRCCLISPGSTLPTALPSNLPNRDTIYPQGGGAASL